jgi:site-specific DNA-methyltransferase (adenine-specific)
VIALNRVHLKDAFEGLAGLPDESIDLVVTDPPYGIASPKRSTIRKGRVMSTQAAWGAWDTFRHPFDYDLMILRLISECFRVLKRGGALYMFLARENCGFFIRQAVARGFTYRNELALVKTTPLPSLHRKNWRSAFELCMYLVKGPTPAAFNFVSQRECVNTYPHPSSVRVTDHPTEKPLEMIRRIVRVSSNPGDFVLDPFMGSGTTAAACVETGRRFVGFETDAAYVRMAEDRIAAARLKDGASPVEVGKPEGVA